MRQGLLLLPLVFLLHSCALGTAPGARPFAADIEVTLVPTAHIGGSHSALLTLGGQPWDLGFVSAVAAGGGYLFVVDSTLPGVLRVDVVSGELRVLHTLREATTTGIYARPDHIVYVVDRFNRAVIELDENGQERRSYRAPRLVAMPVDVALTNWGSSIVIADELEQRLVLFDSLSTLIDMLPSELAPVSIAASISAIATRDEFIFVLDSESREVAQLDLYGRITATYGEDALLIPVAMAVDECHRIFVADGHPDGLFVTSPDFFGSNTRAELPGDIVTSVTDLWVDGSELYVAAGLSGVKVLEIEPRCPAR